MKLTDHDRQWTCLYVFERRTTSGRTKASKMKSYDVEIEDKEQAVERFLK